MKCLMIISTIFVLVYSRPQATPEYQYSSPEKSNISSYAVPLNSVGPLPTIRVGNASDSDISSHNTLSSTQKPRMSYHVDKSAGNTLSKASASNVKPSSSLPSPKSSNNQSHPHNIMVHKYVYVHFPPSDIETDHRPKVHFKPPPLQKHYKIIFIKAPTPLAPRVPHIPVLRQSEEKTLVYVLVKKLEEQFNTKIPTHAPNPPSRPEVYFINYQSRKEKSSAKGVEKVDEASARYGASKLEPGSSGNSGRSTSNREVFAQKESPKSSRAGGPY